jgi:hypothetical protein
LLFAILRGAALFDCINDSLVRRKQFADSNSCDVAATFSAQVFEAGTCVVSNGYTLANWCGGCGQPFCSSVSPTPKASLAASQSVSLAIAVTLLSLTMILMFV